MTPARNPTEATFDYDQRAGHAGAWNYVAESEREKVFR